MKNKNDKFFEACITSGGYKTKNFYSKRYKTASGLRKGLIKHGYIYDDAFNGAQWSRNGKNYRLTFLF